MGKTKQKYEPWKDQGMTKHFYEMVRTNKNLYRSDDNKIIEELVIRKQITKAANKHLKPYIQKNNPCFCHTCGTRNQSHPETSYCFICNTDNW